MAGEWRYNFPKDTWHSYADLEDVLKHASGEVVEAGVALNDVSDVLVAVEIMDAIHVLESALRMIERGGVNLDVVREAVIAKNADRGYYVSAEP